MRKTTSAIFAAGLLLPAGAYAQDPIDYGYLDVGLSNQSAPVGDDFTGFGVRGSLPLNSDLYLAGEFMTGSADSPAGDIDRTDFAIGVGYHMPLARTTDFFAQVDLLSMDMDNLGSDDGLRITGGVRSKVAEQLELRGSLQYVDVIESEVVLNLGAQFHFNRDWAAFVELSEGDDLGGYMLGARFNF